MRYHGISRLVIKALIFLVAAAFFVYYMENSKLLSLSVWTFISVSFFIIAFTIYWSTVEWLWEYQNDILEKRDRSVEKLTFPILLLRHLPLIIMFMLYIAFLVAHLRMSEFGMTLSVISYIIGYIISITIWKRMDNIITSIKSTGK